MGDLTYPGGYVGEWWHTRRHRRKELPHDLGGKVALLCRSGARASRAQSILFSAGTTNTCVVDGTVDDFEKAGGAVVRGAATWAMDRQVRMVAGSLVPASVVGGQLVSPKLRAVAAGVGGGLAYSALSTTCAMANVLSKMPWNQGAKDPSKDAVLEQLAAQ
ncbi:rhodanese-like domain-containing protein [Kocuria arenosa]|uniref:rhodanese-like domain-containing protein n=1 Tax=Kocuria arenosa TaxID=3071446 RepID=UPI0034D3CE8D